MPPFILMVMFMYTENDFSNMISEWSNSRDGHKIVSGAISSYTKSEMKSIAENLKNDIISGYLSKVEESGAQFKNDTVSVVVTGDDSVAIKFSSAGLRRNSLFSTSKKSKSGAYDIFGLFSNGYDLDESEKRSFGTWRASNGNVYRHVYALTSRPATPFVPEIVASYEATYPGLKIKYPGEWG